MKLYDQVFSCQALCLNRLFIVRSSSNSNFVISLFEILCITSVIVFLHAYLVAFTRNHGRCLSIFVPLCPFVRDSNFSSSPFAISPHNKTDKARITTNCANLVIFALYTRDGIPSTPKFLLEWATTSFFKFTFNNKESLSFIIAVCRFLLYPD